MDVQKMVPILQLYKIHHYIRQVQSAVVAMMSKIVSVQGNVSKQIL
jgi:hypothetical protein